MTVVPTEASATLERELKGRDEMDQMETMVISDVSEKPEEGHMRAADIVEWHVPTDADDTMDGALDGCGGCGCGCGGCSITL